MSTVALYELANARDILDTWLLESDGELTPELEQLLAELDGKADEKIERVALYIRERLAHSAAVKEEVVRLVAIQRREERAADSLKAYLLAQMYRLGKERVTGVLCTVALQASPPSVSCELTSDDLGAHYEGCRAAGVDIATDALGRFIVKAPATYRLDARAVLDARKAGEPLPPEIWITNSKHLRIR